MGQAKKTEDQHRRKFRAGRAVRGKDHFAARLRRDPFFHEQLPRRERTAISGTYSAAPDSRLPWRLAPRSHSSHAGSDDHLRLHRIQRPLNGTTTAPEPIIPIAATIHSGRFSAKSATVSPRLISPWASPFAKNRAQFASFLKDQHWSSFLPRATNAGFSPCSPRESTCDCNVRAEVILYNPPFLAARLSLGDHCLCRESVFEINSMRFPPNDAAYFARPLGPIS